jgi:hypothetical protein
MTDIEGSIGREHVPVPAVPDQEETQAATITALRRSGFTEDFHVDGPGISATGHTPRQAPPEEFSVIGTYRFEGASDPDDEAIVLALVHEPTGLMGTFDAAFGPGGSADEATVLTRLPRSAAPG